VTRHRRDPARPSRPSSAAVINLESLDLTIERPVAGGRMLARADGRVVLVAGAIPGEVVRARVERIERGVAFARVDAVLAPSPDRRPPPFDPACGGAAYAHVAPARQTALKREVIVDGLRRGAGVTWAGPLDVAASPEHGYRLRARLHVRDGAAGFFREGTHAWCDAAPSSQLTPATLEAVQRLVAAIDVPVDGVEVSENLDGSERAVHLLPAQPGLAPAPAPVIAGLTGVSIAGRDGRPRTLAGDPRVGDDLARLVPAAPGDARLRRHAASFFQGNRFLVGALASAVLDAVVDDAPVWDLYAGVGLFAAALCATGRERVTAVEGDPVSGADLRDNAAAFAGRLTVETSSVEAALAARALPDGATVIVDPPRTGLSAAVSRVLAASAAPRVVYVSCDVPTLARDLKILRAGGFEIASIAGFDLFPNTAHVESLVVLQR
jgi:tRNA/tmRNA/rRNA uracil-C5-methylase (TrmA/RlmC/RlmD family)